jgi:galactose mutarotase-like enzyme
MKIKYLLIIALPIGLITYAILNWKSELPTPSILEYSQLPSDVQNLFKDRANFASASIDVDNDAYVLESLDKYRLEVKTTGPWTDYYVLENLTKHKKYRIPYGKPFPFVVFNNDLYIPTDYNVSGIEQASSIKYEKYNL